MKSLLLLLFIFFVSFNLFAQLFLPSIFSDNMVLQRNMKIPVWGKTTPKSNVTVKFHEQKKICTADKEGNWKVFLSPISADSNPQIMSIESDNSKIVFNNILVGEVWLCSGQSNMQFPLTESFDAEKYITEARDSRIRFFQPDRYNFKPYECDNCLGKWKIANTNSVKNLTAVGYFFALDLLKKLNVPVGLIESDFGGTIIESWMCANNLRKWNYYNGALDILSQYKNYKTFSYIKEKEKKEWFDKFKKSDPGFKNKWMSEKLEDTSGWKKIKLPRAWDTKYLKGHKGIVWYKKNVNIPDEWIGKTGVIGLGLIRGYDIVWINGKYIGSTLIDYLSQQYRSYNIPLNILKKGENAIVICNLSEDGHAGPRGPKPFMKISLKASISNSIPLAGEWFCKKGCNSQKLPGAPPSLLLWQETLSINYNSQIHPLIPYALRGVLWYQGESNLHNTENYKNLFSTMIKSWREEWEEGEFPFYFVQIAPYNYGKEHNSAFLREAQLQTLELTNTGMAVTLDIGNPKNIHPKNKKDVGHRLALWALAKNYGFTNLVYSGPLYKNYKIVKNKIIISFDYAEGLKTRDGKSPSCFEIAGKNKTFYPASVKIVNDKIFVTNNKVNDPVAVRFAWSHTAEPNLCNGVGLPASTFRTDEWNVE